MTILLIDEDWSKADPVALRAAGYTGVIGYVSEDTTGKNITRAQIDAAHAAGLDVGLVYEYATAAAIQGANRGTRDAAIAVDQALALGAPANVCLYAAVDFNPTPAQMPAVLAYLEAFQQYAAGPVYRAGAYGGYPTCQYLAQHGYTGLLWQTYAWSGGAWWPSAVLRQTQNHITVAGATVDRDQAMAPDWGQWRAGGTMTSPLTPMQDRTLADAGQYGYGYFAEQDPVEGIVSAPDGAPLDVPNLPLRRMLRLEKTLEGIAAAVGTPAPAGDPAAVAAALTSEQIGAGLTAAGITPESVAAALALHFHIS